MSTYTLWGQTGGGTLAADTASYTLGTLVASCRPVAVTGIWFYSPSGASSLPSACVIYDANTQAQVAGTLNNSPSWSGAAGSGWVKCAYSGTAEIGYRDYVVAVLGGGSDWYSVTDPYWESGGTGQLGIANDPLSALPSNFADSAGFGQSLKNAGGTLTFPATAEFGGNFWVDIEVADIPGLPATYSLFSHVLPPDPGTEDSSTAATFGMQFSVTEKCRLDAIWQLNSGVMPTEVGVYQITGTGTGTLLVSVPVSSGSWEGPGIYAWARIAVPAIELVPGVNYEVCSYNGTGSAWMPVTSNYWTSGPGASGITSGILSAPDNAGAVNGQGNVSSSNAFTFPGNSNSGVQAFVDVEVAAITQTPPSLVQAATATAAAATITVTLESATTAGNCLVVCVSGAGSYNGTVTGITLGSAAGNFGALASGGNPSTSAAVASIWADPGCAGGQTSVAVTTSASGSPELCAYVFEFAGLAKTVAGLLDKSATLDSGAGTTATPAVGPAATTTQASEVWVGCVAGYNQAISPPLLPWAREQQISSSINHFMAGYQIVNSTGTATYAPTFGTATYAEGVVVTLKAAPSGLLMASFP